MVKEIELDWEITGGCNLRCKHCIVAAKENTKKDVTYTEITNFLDKLKDYKLIINFTGGEPFFRKDFKDILDYCIENNITVKVITNGLLLSNFNPNEYNEENEITPCLLLVLSDLSKEQILKRFKLQRENIMVIC